MTVPKWVKKAIRWESLLPCLIVLSAVVVLRFDKPRDWNVFFNVITGVVAVTVTAVSFITAGATEKERRHFKTHLAKEMQRGREQFERDLAKEMEADRRQFESDLAKQMENDRQQFESDLAKQMEDERQKFKKEAEQTRNLIRRAQQALDVSRDEISRISGGLHRIAERAHELPEDSRFSIRLPSQLVDIVKFENEPVNSVDDLGKK